MLTAFKQLTDTHISTLVSKAGMLILTFMSSFVVRWWLNPKGLKEA